MSPASAAFVFRANLIVSFILAGVLWAGTAIPAVAPITRWSFDLLNWPIDGDPGELTKMSVFMSAIGGGVLAALGVINWLLVAPAIEAGDRRILNAGLASVFTWFALDSTGSVLSGAASNVGFNAAILALYVLPVLAARKA
ncbi:MAG TPA: hypothetical protein PKM48_11045 [Parvularculaceae bacterium]|nr:hypothetical protein [Parvularculaceae bacterium]